MWKTRRRISTAILIFYSAAWKMISFVAYLILIVSVAASFAYDFRPHRLHAVHRCGLLLQMLHVVWSVCLFVSVCVGHVNHDLGINGSPTGSCNFRVTADEFLHSSAAKAGARSGRVHSSPREVEMLPFANLFWTLVFIVYTYRPAN